MEAVNADLVTVLLKQAPIIIVLVIACYVMWNYVKEKNKLIKEKDTLIIDMNQKLMVLYGQAVEAQTKLTNAIDSLRKDIEKSN